MTRSVFGAFAAIVIAAPAEAQARPDFTGTWVRAADATPTVATTGDAAFRTGDMGSGWGAPLTITQRRDSLVVEYVYFSSYDLQPPVRFAYALDGSESLNGVMIGHATSVQRSRLAWRDSSLTITTLHPVPREAGQAVEVRQTMILTSPTSLTVTTTRPGVRGAPATVTSTYTKR